MAFRHSGMAWDGQLWESAAAIRVLGDQIELIRPGEYPGDGTVASQQHDTNNPNSDHTVWPKTGSGVVYAIDFGEPLGTDLVDEILESMRLSRDARVKYAIHHSRMFSSYDSHGVPAFTWRPYSGYNAHKKHGHVSVYHDSRGDDPSPWEIGGGALASITIEQWQEMCNDAGLLGANGQPLTVDGLFGPNTQHALTQGLSSSQGEKGEPGPPGPPGSLTIRGAVELG